MKKMLSIISALVMLMALVPNSAFAVAENSASGNIISVGEVDVFSDGERASSIYAPAYSGNHANVGSCTANYIDISSSSTELFPYRVAATIQNFDSWTAEDVMATTNSKVTTHAHNGIGEKASFELVKNGENQALKMNRKADQNYAKLNEFVVAQYISEANGVAFHIDATAAKNDINIRVFIDFLGESTVCNWYGKPYYFVEDGKQISEHIAKVIDGNNQWSSWINLAAGKAGTYYIPFGSFQPPEEVAQNSDNYKFDIAGCVGKTIEVIQFQVSGASEDAFIIDDLAWTTADGFWDASPISDLGYKTAKIFQDFNEWNSTTDISGSTENGSKVITWKHNNQGEVPTFELVPNGEGMALKMKRNSANNNALIEEINIRKYIADANGISFYYDGTKVESETNIRITFECDGKTAFPWFSNLYYFVEDGKQMNEYTEKMISGYDQRSSWISLAAGHAGTYFIPFDAFKIPEIIAIDEGNAIYDFDPTETIDKDITDLIFLVADISDDPFIIDDLAWTTADGSWRFWDKNIQNAWTQYEDQWYYIHNGELLVNSWKQDSIGWVYLGSDGAMKTNAWVKDSTGWCWLGADGYTVKNNWVKDGGKWYFLDANGYMVSNTWKQDSKGWCYLGSDGAMKTNAWVRDSVGWCYVGADGYCVTNTWKKDSIGWCYVGADGYCVTSKWMQDSTKKWCYLNSNGNMVVNNWVNDNGKWYFMDVSGYMISNTSKYWNGKTYYFNASGVCTNP